MSSLRRQPLRDIVSDRARASKPQAGTHVWSLNLDQIESDTGRVLAKQMVAVEKLGSSTFSFEAGTVLYSKLRPYLNKVIVAEDAGVATTELVPLRCDLDKLLPEYLAHYLRSPEFLQFASAVVAGAKMPRMVMSEFWDYEIPLPSLPEQRRIAAILDKADALRTKRREALAQLDRLTQAIFIEMFGDPGANPLNWARVQLGELLTAGPQNGLYKPASDYGIGSPILRIDAFYDGVVTKPNQLKRVRVSNKELQTWGLKENDIIVNRVNSREYLGKSALIPYLAEPTVFESNMMRLRLNTHQVLPCYVVQFLQTKFIRAQIATAAKDAVNQSSINQQDVKGFVVNVPPLSLQREFKNRWGKVAAMNARYRDSLETYEGFFTSLQHRAFRGEL